MRSFSIDKPHRQDETAARFLLLPPEMRLQVYRPLFSSTRLTHGQRPITRISTMHKLMKPAPNSLAILSSCRSINRQIGSSWIGQVLFGFERVHDLLEKLSSVPRGVVEQIRHIRVGSQPILLLLPPDYRNKVFVKLVWALKLLPGLRLDTLTVLGDYGPEVAYITLDGLVNCENGWRELHYITADCKMLGFRRVQFYHQILLESFGVDEDPELMHEDNARKERLVVVRRGEHAKIAEDATETFHKDDIRHASGVMTWPEIKETYDWQPSDSEDEARSGEEQEFVEYDSYVDVNEYTNMPLD
ncbi:hypothetical protein BJX65DRAFT_308236 [Aspergillus insuetus]